MWRSRLSAAALVLGAGVAAAPVPPADREILLVYLVRHFRDPAGR